jgi:hypothetical protein
MRDLGQGANGHLRAEVAAADADVDDVAQALRRRAVGALADVLGEASIASRTAWTSSLNGALPRGARNATWSTARRSVLLTGAPASMASRWASTPHSRARSARKRSVAASTRFFDRSAKTSGASNDIDSNRRGSRANASRRSKSRPCASKWPASAAQAAVRSQRTPGRGGAVEAVVMAAMMPFTCPSHFSITAVERIVRA